MNYIPELDFIVEPAINAIKKQNEAASLRQRKKDIQLIAAELVNWNKETSTAFKFLTRRFNKVTKPIILSLAHILSFVFGIPQVTREAYRDKRVLIKWYDDHFDQIQPIIDNFICIKDQNFHLIGNQSDQSKNIMKSFQLLKG